ncbi:biotin carboxylase [Paenibacillus shirakamiensis]|uniref:Biotin carboxylase n=1 Tax=Paenibacillus shirakamiensis TaxID=1265935 RepID=A0ABS4JB99_9BACL|nr:ATP-grasp domain-containing protein [Paenibacillus shirakamiensis]MBP1998987.1 biotin carboxylase [Paenibacillus shirakamiensis]
MTNSILPKVAIFYGQGSASPLSIQAASVGVCNIVFLYREDCSSSDLSQIKVLDKYVKSYNISNVSEVEIKEILLHERVQGITTFSEYKLLETSLFVEKMGLFGNSTETANALVNKFMQRQILSTAKGTSVRFTRLDKNNMKQSLSEVGTPAIIKPVVGAGSKWTKKVNSYEELEHAVHEFPLDHEYVLEEFLSGHKGSADSFYGDYVSVESVHQGGKSTQISITGKLPLTPHFAESGMFLPHPFSKEMEDKIRSVDAAAIKALNITSGTTHTEIKITDDGPKIIEVNGRMGGYVSEILKRATGVDLIRLTLQISLNQEVSIQPIPMNKVYYQIFLTPPSIENGIYQGITGLETLKDYKDITHVQITKKEGETIDSRLGTENNIGIVYGESEDFQQFVTTINLVRSQANPLIVQQKEVLQ